MRDQFTHIIALRHGLTSWNALGRVQGHLDVALNATGREQANLSSKALQKKAIDSIYSSDLLRAYETAQAIAEPHKLSVVTQEDLRERAFGAWEGLTYEDINTQWPLLAAQWRNREPDFAPPDGGESLFNFRVRILHAVDHLAKSHLGQTIVMVAHGGVMDVLYRDAHNIDIPTPRTWQLNNAAIHNLTWSPRKLPSGSHLQVQSWNEIQHLQGISLDETHS